MAKSNNRKSNRDRQKRKPLDSSNAHQTKQNTGDAAASQQTNSNVSGQVPPIIVNVPKQDDSVSKETNRISRMANTINILAIIVNAGILVATYFILNATRRTADVANKTFQEMKTEFENDNKPFIQLRKFKVIFADEQRRILRFEPELTNYGKHSIVTISSRKSILYDTAKYEIYSEIPFAKPKHVDSASSYYMKEIAEPYPIHTETSLPPNIYEGVWAGIHYIYIWGEIKYKNVVTEKMRTYEFVVRLKRKIKENFTEEAILYNDNVDIPE